MITPGLATKCSRLPIAPGPPGIVANSEDKKQVRLNVIHHLLSRIPYEEVPHEKVKLPDRKKLDRYKSPDYPFRFIPEVY